MAKKRFTDNFESLFGEPLDDQQPQEQTGTGKQAAGAKGTAADEDRKKLSGKDFSDSLQSFLEETFEASFERQLAEKQEQSDSSNPPAPKPTRRRSSLDLLIRSTVEPSKIEVDEQDRRRRITLTFEPQKLEKLRSIAKLEQAMLKDIINDIVGEYIRKYEREKGR